MKTRKLLFTLVATMTMLFGLTLTAHAEEAAPATKVVGVEGIGTFTVPADWTEEYIDGYGTYWFNPTKTACVAMQQSGPYDNGLPAIGAFATALKGNLDTLGYTFLDWRVTKFLGYDAVYSIGTCPADSNFTTDYPALHDVGFECCYSYFRGNIIIGLDVVSTTVDELQTTLPILVTYQPAK